MTPKKEVNNEEAPSGFMSDDSYKTRRNEPIPVDADDAKLERSIDGNKADSDAQLERDDKDAIDADNIIDERTRGAKPKASYREPGDTEGLPEDTGRSATTQ